ncbi:hypothetical protein METHP14_100031 [Pseudomonas sp. P14-2025]
MALLYTCSTLALSPALALTAWPLRTMRFCLALLAARLARFCCLVGVAMGKSLGESESARIEAQLPDKPKQRAWALQLEMSVGYISRLCGPWALRSFSPAASHAGWQPVTAPIRRL